MTAIHQVLPTFAARDAVGQHALQVKRLLEDHGVESHIFTEFRPAPALRNLTRPIETFGDDPVDAGAVVLYQASTGSTLFEWLLERPETILLNYHNITPSEFFDPWEPLVAAELQVGRMQIEELASVTELAIAVSEYNAEELDRFGYRATSVVPILFDIETFGEEPDGRTVAAVADRKLRGGAEWLFVGRVAPNKCQHDLIKAFAFFRAAIDPAAHLTLIGRTSSARYREALEEFVDELGLQGAVSFPDSVSPAVLSAYYQSADVFVCMSEHEGFCVPLLEAMHHDLPIVAFDAAAIPTTLGQGGLVVPTKAPAIVAETVARVLSDTGLRRRLVAAGRQRVQEFSLPEARKAMFEQLEQYCK